MEVILHDWQVTRSWRSADPTEEGNQLVGYTLLAAVKKQIATEKNGDWIIDNYWTAKVVNITITVVNILANS